MLLIIFRNSMFPLSQSNLQSGVVLSALNHLFKNHIVLSQLEVRKLAHFIEYFFLGLLLTITFQTNHKRTQNIFFFELFIFFAIPVVDETIQIFYEGRTSNVIDVWIDFAGCMAGMGIYYLIRALFHLFMKHP